MRAKVSRKLVIDASIARACGRPEAIYPTSVHCRNFLENVLLTCHHMVMTREIRDEWNKHASKFAQAWKVEMVSRKKVVVHNAESLDRSLWDALENFAKTDGQRGEIVKDIHLLEAALATDQIIVSLDENTARKYFTQAAQRIEALKPIVWVNPDYVEKEQPITWLLAGALHEKERMLGYREEGDLKYGN